MADVNANIGVHIDTTAALAEIKNLQRGLAQFYSSINRSSAAAAAAQRNLQQNLMNSINATGKWTAQMRTIRTSTESFTHSLEKNKFSMGEYFRYAGGATKTFGRLFKSEFDTIGKVAEDRVKKMQTQYIKMGRDANGAMRAIAVTPRQLNLKDHNTQLQIAAQRQALFNQLVKQGSTSLLNFGKNTQWAGRQLMVGFTIPLMYFGGVASKIFMDLEQQAIKFRRVYGDTFTSSAETERALDDIRRLAEEYTKYGVAVTKTMEMAASAAAMGKTGAELTAQVSEATRLAVLGAVEQEQALETTISLTNAFGIAADDLAKKIDFLNAVENQTVVSIEDLTIAIPKAGPVVQQLGGDVEDLAFFLTAMKEGGINASEGANALKSGLASLINPTDKAAAMLQEMGINLKAIVESNAGNVKDIVIQFAMALDQLDPLTRARAIEQLFGKFQFARLSTLFQNVIGEGTQASRVLDLAGKSVEELAILSERELGAVEESVGTKFRAQVEQLKVAMEPIGKAFLEAVTPIVKVVGDLLKRFDNLGEGTKKFIVIATTLVGVIGPVLLMTFGLLANGAANIIKLFLALRMGFLKLTGESKILGQSTQYLTTEQLENETVAASLNQAHSRLTQQFLVEKDAVLALRNAYLQATSAGANFARANPGMMLPGARGPRRYNKGVVTVPGSGNRDTVPALLTPGEAVIPKNVAQDSQFAPIIEAMVSGKIQGFNEGTNSVSFGGRTYTTSSAVGKRRLEEYLSRLTQNPDGTYNYADPDGQFSRQNIPASRIAEVLQGRETAGKLTASEVSKKLGTSAAGQSAMLGSGRPSLIRSLTSSVQASGLYNAETEYLDDLMRRNNVSMTSAQRAEFGGLAASHIDPNKRIDVLTGQKIWDPKDLMADRQMINNYVQGLERQRQLRNVLSLSDAEFARTLGISETDAPRYKAALSDIRGGWHPNNPTKAAALGAYANYDFARNPNNPGAFITANAMNYRLQTGFFGRKMPILERILQRQQSLGQRRGQTVVQRAVVNEAGQLTTQQRILDRRGKTVAIKSGPTGLVRSTTGFPINRLDADVQGGTRRDTRVVATQPDEAILNRNSTRNLRNNKPVNVPGLGTLVRIATRGRVPGMAEGFPAGQEPLSQAELRRRSIERLYGGKEPTQEDKVIRKQLERLERERLAGIRAENRARRQAIEEQQRANKETKKNSESIKNSTKATNAFGSKVVAGSTAVGMLAVGASFLGGEIGKIANVVSMAAFALAAVVQIGPMFKGLAVRLGAFLLANPFVAAAAALTAVIVGYKIIQERNKAQARAQSDYIDSITATTEKMKQIGEITGEVGASEIAARRREAGTANRYLTGFERAGQGFGTTFLASELGAEMLKVFTEEVKKDRGQAIQNLGLELASYVSDGVISGVQAEDISRALGIALGDMSLSVGIDGELRSLVGFEGTDLLRDPLTVRMRIARESISEISSTINGLVDIIETPVEPTSLFVPGQVTGTNTAPLTQIQPGQTQQRGPSTGMGPTPSTANQYTGTFTNVNPVKIDTGIMRNLVAGGAAVSVQALESLQAQRDAQFLYYEDLIRSLESEKQKTKTLEEQEKIQKRINDLKAKQAADDKQLAGLSQNIFTEQQKLLKQAEATGTTTFFWESLGQQVTRKFKGTAQEGFAKAFIQGAGQIEDQEVRLRLTTFVGSNLLSPANANSLLTMFAGKTADMNAVVKSKVVTENPDKFNELISILNTVTGPNAGEIQTTLMTEITSPGGEAKFENRMAVLNQLTKLDGKEINMGVFLEGEGALEKIDTLSGQFEVIEAIPDVNKKSLEVTAVGQPELQAMIDGWEHYKNLPEEVQKTAVQTFMTIFTTMSDDPAQRRRVASYVASRGGTGLMSPNAIDAYVERMANTVDPVEIGKLAQEYNKLIYEAMGLTTPPPTGGEDDKTGGGAGQNILEEILTRLRAVRDASVKVGGNLKYLQGIVSKGIIGFKGLETQLAKTGKNRAFIDFLSGLDDKTLKTFVNAKKLKKGIVELTPAGKALNEVYNEVTIGDYNDAQVKAIDNALKQQQAFLKLTAAGVDSATAYEMIADEQLAVAINAKSTDGKELRTMARNAKEAKAALKEINEQLELSSFIAGKLEDLELLRQMPGLVRQMQNLGLSVEQMDAVLGNPTLASQLMKDLADGKLDAKAIADYLNSIPETINLQFNLDMQTAAGRRRQFDILQSQAEEYFNILESEIEDDYEDSLRGLQNIIRDIDDTIADAQRKIQGYQNTVEDIQRSIEITFSRPIEALQEISSDLSNDLTLIDRATEEINDRYEKQIDALNEISKINEDIANQKKQQLTIADALSRGDISAAAAAAEDARAQQAAAAIQASVSSLERAKTLEIERLRSASGMSRADIEKRQFEISQQIFNLEEQREAKLLEIQALEDKIYNIQTETIRTQELRKQEHELEIQRIEREKEKRLDVIRIQREAWTDALIAINLEKIAQGEFNAVIDATNALMLITAGNARNITTEIWKSVEAANALKAAQGSSVAKPTEGATQTSTTVAQAQAAADAAISKAQAVTAAEKAKAEAVMQKVQEEKASGTLTKATAVEAQKVVTQSANTALASIGDAIDATRKLIEEKKKEQGIVAPAVQPVTGGFSNVVKNTRSVALAAGGMITKYMANGGMFKSINTDTIPAMLTAGEFVVRKAAVQDFGVKNLEKINAGTYSSGSVYNYNLNVNVRSDADPNQIARTVMTQIRNVDSQRIRGQR